MSYQPPQPPVNAPQGNAGAAVGQDERLRALIALLHSPQGNEQIGPQAEALNVEALIKQLPEQPSPLYGEVPGEGYLYQGAPTKRQETLVTTTPEVVRDALLRGIETAAQNSLLPFSENKPAEWGHAALMFAQAYLLLDPEVDNEGVPVGAKAVGEAAAGHAEHAANASVDAANTQAAEEHVTESGYKEPPRVKLGAAAQKVGEKNKDKSEILKGGRGDNPRPQPRVGS